MTDPGRRLLTEADGLALAERLGLGTPPRVLLSGHPSQEEFESGLEALGGEQVVLKAQAAGLVHKTEAGAVVILPRDVAALTGAFRSFQERFGASLEGALLEAFVPHVDGVEGELILGYRDTPEYGPVLTVGPGGTLTEFWAEAMGAEGGPMHLAPWGWTAASLEAALETRPWFRLLTRGVRGRGGGMAASALVSALQNLLDGVASLPAEGICEAEFNPTVVTPTGLVALDALVREGPRSVGDGGLDRARELGPLLSPRSVAIMGASARGMNPGRIILRNTLAQGFPPERVVVVKPGLDELDGCRCVGEVGDLPAPVDLLVMAVPAAQIPDLLTRVVVQERARSVILIPGGLGEIEGTQGRVEEIRAALRGAAGRAPVVNGGNCLGIRSVSGGVNTLFIPGYKLGFPDRPADPLALISQSGAFAVARLSELSHLNPELVVTVGNQLDLTLGDYLVHLVEREEIRVVAVYAEGFQPGDGARFMRAARTLRAQGRCVIVYRAGRTAAGRDATASHTASMTGDFALTAELGRAAGVLLAETVQEFDDLVRVAMALHARPVGGSRLAAVSNAGFEAVGFADHAGTLALADLTPRTRQAVADHLREGGLEGIVTPANPMDLTPMAGDETYEGVVRTLLDAPEVDVAVVGCVPLTAALRTLPASPDWVETLESPDSVVSRFSRIWDEGMGVPWVCVVDGGRLYDPMAEALRVAGIPVFRSGDRAVRVLARYVEWRTG